MRRWLPLLTLAATCLGGCGSAKTPAAGSTGVKPVGLIAHRSGWHLSGRFQPAAPLLGRNAVVFSLKAPPGGRLTGPIMVTFAMPGMDMGFIMGRARRLDDGSYRASTILDMAGAWQVTVAVPTGRGTVNLTLPPFVVQ